MENNYTVFERFVCTSSNTLLAILYRLGYFNNDNRLLCFAGEIIDMREVFSHEEEDVAGHIAFLLLNYQRNRIAGNEMLLFFQCNLSISKSSQNLTILNFQINNLWNKIFPRM